MWISHCAGSSHVVSASKPTVFCFVSGGWGWNSEKSISQIPWPSQFLLVSGRRRRWGKIEMSERGGEGTLLFPAPVSVSPVAGYSSSL